MTMMPIANDSCSIFGGRRLKLKRKTAPHFGFFSLILYEFPSLGLSRMYFWQLATRNRTNSNSISKSRKTILWCFSLKKMKNSGYRTHISNFPRKKEKLTFLFMSLLNLMRKAAKNPPEGIKKYSKKKFNWRIMWKSVLVLMRS